MRSNFLTFDLIKDLNMAFLDLTNNQQNDYKVKWDRSYAKVGQPNNHLQQACPTSYERSSKVGHCIT